MCRSEDIVCPFCGEKDFDLIGLKMHLERGWCAAYEDVKAASKDAR